MTVPSQDKFRCELLSKLKKLLFSRVCGYRTEDIIGLQHFGNNSPAPAVGTLTLQSTKWTTEGLNTYLFGILNCTYLRAATTHSIPQSVQPSPPARPAHPK